MLIEMQLHLTAVDWGQSGSAPVAAALRLHLGQS